MLQQLAEARPGIQYTSPGIAGHRALHHIGAKRVALLTPYPVAVHQDFLPFFHKDGFEVVSDGTFDRNSDAEIGELTRASLFYGAHELVDGQKVDALFVSCTATPIVPHIQALEEELGIPVVSSSQAMAWDVLRMTGYGKPVEGYGKLMQVKRVSGGARFCLIALQVRRRLGRETPGRKPRQDQAVIPPVACGGLTVLMSKAPPRALKSA